MTNVPGIVFSDTGLIVPPSSAVLAGTTADINAAFGGNLNGQLTSPQGQLATTLAAIIAAKNQEMLVYVNNVDPAFSSGRMQDGIARIYFIDRIPARSTIVTATCTGAVNTPIPAGSLAIDINDNLYISLTSVVIPSSGSIDVQWAAIQTGPNPCAKGALNRPYKIIEGWDTINNVADGVLGRNVETAQEFEARRFASVSINANGMLSAIRSLVLATEGVTDCYVYDNSSNTPLVIGDYAIARNSIYIAVVGGNANDVAKAIWTKKGPGCSYNGNTSVQVFDDRSFYSQPYPAYTVLFEIPTNTPIFFSVTLAANDSVPENAIALVQNAILLAFAGSDGGTRASIASLLLASRYYPGVIQLGSWVEILSIKIGYASNDYQDDLVIGIDQMPVVSASDISVIIGDTSPATLSIGTGT